MIWIDLKYANLLSIRLDKFKVKKNSPYLANFNCAMCDDGRKRGFLIERSGKIQYYCHNCGYSKLLGSAIKALDPTLYNEYRMESLKESGSSEREEERPEVEKRVKASVRPATTGLVKISSLSPDHPAKKYVVERKVPPEQHYRLFYTDKYKTWVNSVSPGYFPDTKRDEPRLVIPYLNQEGKMIAAQGRSLRPDAAVRYITVVFDETFPKVFGVDKYDPTKDVFVVEGPIDSFFAPNSLALGGGENSDIERVVRKEKAVFVFDNEPRNIDTIHRIEKAIDNGYRVVIFPETIEQKDLNDMVRKGGYSLEELSGILCRNQFSGIAAKLRLSEWKRHAGR